MNRLIRVVPKHRERIHLVLQKDQSFCTWRIDMKIVKTGRRVKKD